MKRGVAGLREVRNCLKSGSWKQMASNLQVLSRHEENWDDVDKENWGEITVKKGTVRCTVIDVMQKR